MAINMFEGARRIAKLVAVFIVGGFAIAIVFGSSESVYVQYAISGPRQLPTMDTRCAAGSRSESLDATSKKGRPVRVTLCFLAQDFEVPPALEAGLSRNAPRATAPEIQRLIPYRIDQKTVWGNEKYSNDVSAYVEREMARFQIPLADEGAIEDMWWSQKLKNAGQYFLGMIASLAALWSFTWATGWIVRGFMGIPRGQDQRP